MKPMKCHACDGPAYADEAVTHNGLTFCDKHCADAYAGEYDRCSDCGKRGERAGHQDCQFPEDH